MRQRSVSSYSGKPPDIESRLTGGAGVAVQAWLPGGDDVGPVCRDRRAGGGDVGHDPEISAHLGAVERHRDITSPIGEVLDVLILGQHRFAVAGLVSAVAT